MNYEHILVAVDLSDESSTLVKKATFLAKALDSKVSFIHIDVHYSDLYSGLIDINLIETQHQSAEASKQALAALAKEADYPIESTYVGSGDLSNEICECIEAHNVDLIVCGHHQDFWSKLLSSTKLLINCSPVDMLIVPLKD
ncbi:universal stress protein [Vibrio sp. RC27]